MFVCKGVRGPWRVCGVSWHAEDSLRLLARLFYLVPEAESPLKALWLCDDMQPMATEDLYVF